MAKYLDSTGLTYLWAKIKAWVGTYVSLSNGTITIGSNSIAPLTSHQDISGKADVATTLAGYGITDAKIANGVITLGSNSITPLTSFTESDPTVPSWAKASSKPSYTASEVGAVATTAVGAASGVCPLNSSSKIDATYLPSYVDDVIEAYARTGQTALTSSWLATGSASGTVITPETGKIYVDTSTNKTYRWSSSAYVEISESLALGETSSTASPRGCPRRQMSVRAGRRQSCIPLWRG